VRFRILGPLQVGGETAEVALGGRTQRTVLAVLLANSGQLVPLEYVVDAVWDDSPPATAKRQIQNYVAALRRLVAAGAGRPMIVTDGPGYRIVLDDGDLDAAVFACRVAAARELAGRGQPAEAAAEFRSALGLWRGPALFGLTGRIIEAAAAGLDDQRLAATEECVDLELRLGRHGGLVGELTELVAANPLRERLVGQLMLALYRSGRQADALQAYHRLRTTLADDMGVDPAAELQRTYTAILANDPAAAAPPGPPVDPAAGPPPARSGAGPPAGEPGAAVSWHLPRPVPDFVGRSAMAAGLLAAVPAEPCAPAVLALSGMAGVGKTTLAVHLAHRLTGRYPDAQLYVDLHGHAEREPDDAGAALSLLLRQLGVAAARVPESVDDRVALWRAELARRRVLVLLDNAAGSRQVAPLLPGVSDTLVIVTSRRLLAGLDGAHAVSLGMLSAADAAELLRQIVGTRVVEAPEAAAELARLCGHLPLALRLAAARLLRRSSWSVAELNDRLRDAPGRLRQLGAEDRTVSAALDLSYQQLDAGTRWLFRALGCHPRAAFDRYAAAALADLDVAEVDGRLEELVDAYLLETPAAGRYRLHDLLHDHAGTLLAAEPERAEAAVRRLLTHYLHTTASATAHYERPAARASLTLGEPPPTVPPFADTPQAVAWLDADWLTVVAAVKLADARGDDDDTWRLARALWPYLYRNAHTNELIETLHRALRAARHRDDAAATIHNYLASGYTNLRRYDAADEHLRKSYAIRRRLGDQRGVIIALNNLALLQIEAAGRPRDALDNCQKALALAEQIGAEHDVYLCARTLGFAYRMLGRYDDALACLQRALAGFQRTGQTSWQSMIVGELGCIHAALGDHVTAVRLLREALTMKQREGNRIGTVGLLSQLGEVYQALGRGEEALECHREALANAPEDHHGEPRVLNGYGRTLLARGEREAALAAHRRVLAQLGQVGNRYEQAKAHDGAAAALCDVDPAAARVHWRQALEIYRDMGLPDAAAVRRRLAELPDDQPGAARRTVPAAEPRRR
jgi:DNA-binding SARP family transcriptional activator/tetratricopeptide (TPR) repeat protein